MTNQEYQKHLETKSVKALKDHYEKIFTSPPPSKWRKKQIVNKLCEKFEELNAINPNADDFNPDLEEKPKEKTSPTSSHNNNGKLSRRSTIIALAQENIWDKNTLAEWLQLLNPEDWRNEKKNKAAISGTLSDMKRNHGWVVKEPKGRIMVC